jgi:chemotaxis protein MotB
MAHGEHAQPIIFKKKKVHGHGHHGGAWKVAYADFVTAMMAFFLVMWLVGQSPQVKNAVSAYFQDPVGFEQKMGDMGPQMNPTGHEGPSAIEGMLKAPGAQELPARPRDDREARLREAAKGMKRSLKRSESFQAIAENVEVKVTEEGVLIDLIEDVDSTFFERGGTELSEQGLAVVREIGQRVAAEGFEVIVEGHTDSVPFKGAIGYTNWELSADRANTARRVLEEAGVPAERFRAVRGFADRQPRNPAQPEDPRNRRVSILVSDPSGAS